MLTRLRWGLALLASTAGVTALVAPDPAAPATGSAVVGTAPAPVVLSTPVAGSTAPPTRVTIPAIGVDSDVTPIGVDAAGALVPPVDYDQAGWFAAGPAPGEIGPAVLAGHVDDRTGPAVFFRLEELTPGDQVVVTSSDGQAVAFAVTRVTTHPKDDFPTAEVYGPTTDPELRLITCGGAFDRSRRSYTDDVVVYARAT